MRTNIGKNLSHIKHETGLNPWLFGTARIKSELTLNHTQVIPESETWRVIYLEKLLIPRTHAHYNGDIEIEDEMNKLISALVST